MFTLEILQKVFTGTLKAHEARHIADAAPLLDRYAPHKQPDVLAAMLEARVRAVQGQGYEAQRDAYWEALFTISGHGGGYAPTASLLLDHLENPRYPAHTQQEYEQRSKEIEDRQQNPTLPPLVRRQNYHSYFWMTFGIMTGAFRDGQRDNMLRAARLVREHYEHELWREIHSTTVKKSGVLLGLNPGTFKLKNLGTTGAEQVATLRRQAKLADELDAALGVHGTKYELIKATLIQALLPETPPETSAYILRQADRMPVKHKADVVDHNYTVIYYEKDQDTKKSVCGTLEPRHRAYILYTSETDILDAYLAILQKWSQRHKSVDFTTKFFGEPRLDHYEYQSFKEKGIYAPAVKYSNHFDPTLKWPEIARRLEMQRSAWLPRYPNLKPFTIAEDEYLEFAAIRALEYGHADDLADIMAYCKALPPDVREARGFEGEFPRRFPRLGHQGKVSRSPEVIQLLVDNLPVGCWIDTSRRSDMSLLVNMMMMPSSERDVFKLSEWGVSYVSNGQHISAEEMATTWRILFETLHKIYPDLPQDARNRVAHDIHRLRYNSPAETSKDAIQQTGDPDALARLVRGWYLTATPEEALETAMSFGHSLMSHLSQTHYIKAVAEYFRAIHECDPDKSAWLTILERTTARKSAAVIAITQAIAPDKIDLSGDEPGKRALRRFIGTYADARMDIDDFMIECKAAEGIQTEKHRYSYHPNLAARLQNQLYPYLEFYEKLERSNGHFSWAHKLAHLFDNMRQVDTFMRHHLQPTRTPVHDLCEFSYDQSKPWDKRIWGNLAIRYGHPILRLLPLAPKIEAYFREYIEPLNERRRSINRDRLGKTGHAVHDRTLSLETMTPSMLRTIAARVGYKRESENRPVASFCIDLGCGEDSFNKTLDLMDAFSRSSKGPDLMPHIIVEGYEIGLPGYKMVRVPHGDPLNLWIGKIVNCCNHLEGAGSDMAEKQFSHPHNGLYIIRDKRDRPVAKLSGWISERGNLVFNAWERKSETEDRLLVRFTLAAAVEALLGDKNIKRVTLGAGPLHAKQLPFAMVASPEVPAEGVGSTSDSKTQFLLAAKRTLGAARRMLADQVANPPAQTRIKLTYREMEALGLI